MDAPRAVAPTFSYFRGKLATVCWVNNLLKTNRERLYSQVVKGVLSRALSEQSFDKSKSSQQRMPFELVRVPGDGKCGWRAILASQNALSYKEVPRSVILSLQ